MGQWGEQGAAQSSEFSKNHPQRQTTENSSIFTVRRGLKEPKVITSEELPRQKHWQRTNRQSQGQTWRPVDSETLRRMEPPNSTKSCGNSTFGPGRCYRTAGDTMVHSPENLYISTCCLLHIECTLSLRTAPAPTATLKLYR